MSSPILYDERKTNERPGVRAVSRNARFSASKAREVLNLIRGKSVAEARTILELTERGAAETIIKVLDSAVANAGNNNDIPPQELFVATAYADEGTTLKRFKARARGQGSRINRRTCHITIIVGRYTQTELDAINERLGQRASSADASVSRARRVAKSRQAEDVVEEEVLDDEVTTDDTIETTEAVDTDVATESNDAAETEEVAADTADTDAADEVEEASAEVDAADDTENSDDDSEEKED